MSASTAFDFDTFLTLPRLGSLDVSPDGTRLAVAVQRAAASGTAFESSVWELDPTGDTPPRRLTRWAQGGPAPRYAPDGSLLFLASGRGEADGGEPPEGAEAAATRLLRLPALPGEATPVAAPAGGVTAFSVARDSGRVVLGAPLYPGTSTWEEDAAHHAERTEAKLTAQLHEHFPVRYWDRWLGPRERHLFAQGAADGAPFSQLTAGAGFALEFESFDVAPDGRTVATTWYGSPADPRDEHAMLVLVAIDDDGTAGERTVLLDEPRVTYAMPAWAPSGDRIACIRKSSGTPEHPEHHTLVVVDVATGQWRDLLGDLDRWPLSVTWGPDGRSLYYTADDAGHCLPFRVDLDSGEVTRLAPEGAYSQVVAAPGGDSLYAMRCSVAEPPHVVALDARARDQEPHRLPVPGMPAGEGAAPTGYLRHRVERVTTEASDGVRVPGWLVLPAAANGPAPLAVFIHGGPLSSWNAWHWRWNPHLLAARGWAVLLPDPALSTGYGRAYLERGWGRWGAEPYTDLMALVETVCARDDVDGERTAAMGGSFGGYMANWVAGHSDRFDAIVTHASLWNLEAFHGVTDVGPQWENEFGDRYLAPERYREWSPHRFVDRITTPMLVIHGERDFRVPVSEGLALWTDLRRHGVTSAFLHFPDETHWVLAPQHARVWYDTVFAWLDHHVLGKPWQRPQTL